MNFLEFFPAINNSSLKTYENILNTYICFTTLKTVIKNAGYLSLLKIGFSFIFILAIIVFFVSSKYKSGMKLLFCDSRDFVKRDRRETKIAKCLHQGTILEDDGVYCP